MAGIVSKINLFYPTFDKNPSSVKFHPLRFHVLRISHSSSFHGVSVYVQGLHRTPIQAIPHASTVKMNLSISKSLKWWEKDLQSNMKQISSAQDLVDSMLNAGNRLVVIEFFSPGCGGCRVLHPKICQIAEQHPHVQFLQVNYEEHKSMCYTLNVHVLPFFRFYRGAHGRLCSFSCTNATIKKFRDALEKHTTDCCSLGPPKGLDESELLGLSGNKDLSFDYVKKDPYLEERKGEIEPVPKKPQLPSPITKTLQESAGKSLTPTGR